MKKKRKAFTLAEALVVIAILAIIAGITIPVVKKQSFNEQTTTQLKKGYQSLEASLDGAIVDNGPIDNWTGDKFQKYIVPQLKTIKKCSAADISDCFSGSISGLTSAVVLPDKVVIANSGDDYYIDVNGPAAPNQIDVDIYKFVLQKVEDDSDDTAGVLAMLNNMFIPSAYAAVFTETPTMQGDDIWSHHVTDNNAAMDRFESATGGGGGGGSSPKPTVETPVYNPNTPALLPNDTLTPIDPNKPLPDFTDDSSDSSGGSSGGSSSGGSGSSSGGSSGGSAGGSSSGGSGGSSGGSTGGTTGGSSGGTTGGTTGNSQGSGNSAIGDIEGDNSAVTGAQSGNLHPANDGNLSKSRGWKFVPQGKAATVLKDGFKLK